MALTYAGQRNGRIASNMLAAVLTVHLLHPVVAVRFMAMRAALFAATGVWIGITEAYRSLEDQDRIFRARYTPGHASGVWYAGTYWRKLPWVPAAAVPGTSNHGWGLAVDISGYGTTSSVAFRWLLDHAGAYGFSWTTGRNVNEPWHWEYVGSLASWLAGTSTDLLTPKREEDMELIYLRVIVNGKVDTGVKGVIGSLNVKFRNPGERTYFTWMWGTPEAPKNDRVHITYMDVDPKDLGPILAVHGASHLSFPTAAEIGAAVRSALPTATTGDVDSIAEAVADELLERLAS